MCFHFAGKSKKTAKRKVLGEKDLLLNNIIILICADSICHQGADDDPCCTDTMQNSPHYEVHMILRTMSCAAHDITYFHALPEKMENIISL